MLELVRKDRYGETYSPDQGFKLPLPAMRSKSVRASDESRDSRKEPCTALSKGLVEFTAEQIADLLPEKGSCCCSEGRAMAGTCPVHKGEKPSFAVNPQTGLATCHSECGVTWNVAQLEGKLQGLSERAAFRSVCELVRTHSSSEANTHARKLIARYPYCDEEGVLLYEVVRYEPKQFGQRRPNGKGGMDYKLGDVRRVLDNLPAVLKANEVFIVEGEKDVATLTAWGLVATCNSGGAMKWTSELSKDLAGKAVVILPDNDEKGLEHAQLVSKSVQGIAASCVVVQLPGLAVKGDITDWATAGGNAKNLLQLGE
jgi:hypothetical protein